jgi:hypothetical protein
VDGIAVFEDCGIGDGSSIVGLGEGRVELDGFGCICDGVAIRFELYVGLGTVGVEGGFVGIGFDGFGIEFYGGGPVMVLERFIASRWSEYRSGYNTWSSYCLTLYSLILQGHCILNRRHLDMRRTANLQL